MHQEIPSNDSARSARAGLIPLLIVVSLAVFTARVVNLTAPTGNTAMLSANDRSRWCIIRALGDHGTYQIDSIIRERDPESGRRIWHTIDRVRHRGWDGREHDYSSKPPLYPTLLAGEYYVLKHLTGATLAERPLLVVRSMVWFTNGLLLLAFWWAVARWLRRWTDSAWSTAVLFSVAAFGTFLTTFAVTLNNHLVAAVCCAWTADALVAIGRGERKTWRFALAGGCAALTAANELPALSLLAAVLVYLMWVEPKRTLLGAVPAIALIAAAFFGTNYIAHQSLRPPYAHRGEGDLLTRLDRGTLPPPSASVASSKSWSRYLSQQTDSIGKLKNFRPTGRPGRWTAWDLEHRRRLAIRIDDDAITIRQWDDWYDYPGSYWVEGKRRGVDRGEPSKLVYAFHVLIGRHGIFSLTPFWLLAIWGCWIWWKEGGSVERSFVLLTTALTLVCLAFFLTRPQIDRNYGGMTTGFRWLFWLIPLWLGTTIPAVSKVEPSSLRRGVVYVLIAVSVFSAAYGWQQPWSLPWPYRL